MFVREGLTFVQGGLTFKFDKNSTNLLCFMVNAQSIDLKRVFYGVCFARGGRIEVFGDMTKFAGSLQYKPSLVCGGTSATEW